MRIKYSKDYAFNSFLRERDLQLMQKGYDITWVPPQNYTWEEKDVDIDELHELIYKGYAIRINC